MAETADLPASYKTFAELTLSSSERSGGATALVDDAIELTFHELECAAHALAREFQARGVSHGDHVVIMGPHTATQVVAMFATSLLGAVFVPMDAALPQARLRRLLRDVRPRLVIATDASRERLGAAVYDRFFDWRVAQECVNANLGVASAAIPVTPERAVEAGDVAYVMYTAGSAGNPRGVQIEHHALITFFETYNAKLGIATGDRCLNTAPFHLDVCLLDVFLPLYFGATVYLNGDFDFGQSVLHKLAQHRITHFHAAGALLAQITHDGSSLDRYDLAALRVLQTGAEASKPVIVNQWLRRLPQLCFVNTYGPPEVTVGCIQFRKLEPGLLGGEHCPIGMPHAGTSVLLLNAQGHEVAAPWLVGELLLGGEQLMRGYLNAPESTRRAFIEFEGELYYRSGDLAYRDPQGLYWFVGRSDDQVKWLGHRVHLHELRDTLTFHPEVYRTAAGIVHDAQGRKQLALVVQVVRAPSAALARSLREHLPSHLLPGVIGFVVSWPRLPSGRPDIDGCLESLAQAAARSFRGVYVLTADGFEPLSPTESLGAMPSVMYAH